MREFSARNREAIAPPELPSDLQTAPLVHRPHGVRRVACGGDGEGDCWLRGDSAAWRSLGWDWILFGGACNHRPR